MQHTFFCTFLYRQCTTTKWNCLTWRFKEYVNTAVLSFSFFFPYSENDKRTTVLFRTTLTQTTSLKKLIEGSDSRNHINYKLTLLVGSWDPCGFLVMLMVQSPNDVIKNIEKTMTIFTPQHKNEPPTPPLS